MGINTKHRSQAIEIMDDLEMEGDLLIDTLDKLGSINYWLGGNQVALSGLKKLLKSYPNEKVFSIIDLGCGHGDILRIVADFGRKNGYQFKLVGVDANQATIDYANELSKDYPEISFAKQDVLSKEFANERYDIALCTLFLHHFDDEVALNFLQTILNNANKGLIVNDLHRHKLAYYLFNFLTLFINNDMIRNDGLISILKGFKRKDLENFAKKLDCKSTIKWKWAFRYQWIMNKL